MRLRRLVADFQIPGSPQPKGSQKNIGRKGRRAVFVSANPALAGWTAKGRASATESMRMSAVGIVIAPVTVEVVFTFPRPLNQLKKRLVEEDGEYAVLERVEKGLFPDSHLVAPDFDKCLRSVCDVLTGVVIRDDSQVARCDGVKLYATGPGEVGTRVRVFIEAPNLEDFEKFKPKTRLTMKMAVAQAGQYARRRKSA